MAHAITMRELQKLSAASIEQLPGAVPVQSDGRTVALLVPLRPASEAARARFRQALAQAQSQRSLTRWHAPPAIVQIGLSCLKIPPYRFTYTPWHMRSR